MAKRISKNLTLFERDEHGNLLPQEVEVVVDEKDAKQKQFQGMTIMLVPLMRGEIKRMFSKLDGSKEVERDLDDEIIVKCLKDPVYTMEEVKFLKPEYVNVFVNTILNNSGLDMRGNQKLEALDKAEDDFAKN